MFDRAKFRLNFFVRDLICNMEHIKIFIDRWHIFVHVLVYVSMEYD